VTSSLCWQLAEPPAGPHPARRARQPKPDPDLIQATRQAFAGRTGRDITSSQALAVAARIIGSETVRRPASYVAAAIRRDIRPERLLPGTGTPEEAELLNWLDGTGPVAGA